MVADALSQARILTRKAKVTEDVQDGQMIDWDLTGINVQPRGNGRETK